ncbi:MAG: LPS export ABC transporter periplasmic protein LptC [Rhizobiales bacterium]|nr:LPS export ABC transporter periplasmic protein LptC [Hyphomicrobiales bacterium]
MSSLIRQDSAPGARAARRAVVKARLAPMLSWMAVVAGLSFVAVFLVQAGLFAYLVPKEKVATAEVDNPEQITSYDSTITGVDKDNQPYELKAKRGWQDKARPELIHLETVAANFRKSTGEAYNVTSKTARYNSKIKEVDLEGAVAITEVNRFTATMEKAHVVVGDKKLTSDVPVEVTFNGGTVRANGMQITNDGADILFLNGVKAHFEDAAAKGDTSP